jgi:hypothetical protein
MRNKIPKNMYANAKQRSIAINIQVPKQGIIVKNAPMINKNKPIR